MTADTLADRPAPTSKRAAVRSAQPEHLPLQTAVVRTTVQALQRATFEKIAAVLAEASNLEDLPHVRSGESDRLLRIAADLAFDAAETPPKVPECIAFDIGALIKASRLVPGDVENAQRRSLIEAAAVELASLADCLGPASMMDPEADRPLLRGRAGVNTAATAQYNLDALQAVDDNLHRLDGVLYALGHVYGGEVEPSRRPSSHDAHKLVDLAHALACRAITVVEETGAPTFRPEVLQELTFARVVILTLEKAAFDEKSVCFTGDAMLCALFEAADHCVDRAQQWMNPEIKSSSGVDPFYMEVRRP